MQKNIRLIRKEILLTLFFIILIACGSGGGGGGGNGNTNSGPNGDNPSNINIESVPGSILVEPPTRIKASDDGFLYISTDYALIQLNKQGGLKRTLVGNLLGGDEWFWHGFLENPIGLNIVGNYLYAGAGSGKIVKVYTGDDSFESIDIFLHAWVLDGVINNIKIVGNSTTLFYLSDGGIYQKRYNSTDTPLKIIDYITGTMDIFATDNELFIRVFNASDNPILKYDLTTKELSAAISGIVGAYSPMALQGNTFYWVSGLSLYSMDVTSGTPQLLAINIGADTDAPYGNNFGQIAIGDEYVFLTGMSSKIYQQVNIYRVSKQTGISDIIYSTIGFIPSIAVENNKLFFTTASPYIQLNTFSDMWTPTILFDSKDSDLGQASSVWDIRLASGNGKVIMSSGYKWLVYDTTEDTYSITHPILQRPDSFYLLDGSLYSASHNGYAGYSCIASIPITKDIRQPDILNRDLLSSFPTNSVRSTVVDQNFIYWIWKAYSDTGQIIYGISKSALDGFTYEKLFESDGELRDIALHNGELLFTCDSKCGIPGWVLASIPLSGGQPTPVYGLLGDPKMDYKNGIFYVADTYNFINRSLFAISLEQSKDIELLSGLYYQHDLYGDVFIDKSDRWLYVGQHHNLPNGMPEIKISRFKVNGWDNVGPEQIIVGGIAEAVNNLRIGTINTDGSYLYYWHNGEIKRVAE